MKKNILILGGLGFIGTNLIKKLKDDFNLIVFDAGQVSGKPDFKFFQGDFSDANALENIFKNHKITLVIHLISTTIPSSSNQNITFDIESNLISTVKLLELIKKYAVPKILFVSSGGAIYGLADNNEDKIDENHSTYPISSHGIIKLAIEKYIQLYHRLYGLDYLILRLSNPYGENHSSDKQGLINVALRKILKKEKVIIWGNGDIVKDYIYIKDGVDAIHELIVKNISNQIINIGSGKGYSVNEILAIIKKVAGDFIIEKQTAKNFDVPKNILDITKLKSIIDFEPINIKKGIKNTYDWLKTTKY